MGFVYSIIAGLFITLQGVFNTKASEKIGFWETNTLVHGTGLVFAFVILMLFGKGDFKAIKEVNYLYLLGGVFGVFIVFSVMQGISLIGPSLCVAILLTTQLAIAMIIETFGLFGIETVRLNMTRPLGLALIVIGILIFNYK